MIINSSATVMNNSILTPGEWTHLGVNNTVVASGSTVIVAFDYKNVNAANNINGGWNSSIGGGAPANQEYTLTSTAVSGTMAIDHTDLDSTEHTSELRGVQIGSTITLVETGDSARNIELIATGVDTTNTAPYSTYTYDIVSEGSKGPVRDGQTTTVSIDVPIVTDSEYYTLANGFATHPASFAAVSTYVEHNGVDQVLPVDNAYGIALGFQEAFVSSDWQVLAATQTGNSGAEITGRITAHSLKNNDYSLVLSTGNNLGPSLGRSEIEAVLLLNGIDEPIKNVTFKIQDSQDHVFVVSYMANMDEYMYEKLSKAV